MNAATYPDVGKAGLAMFAMRGKGYLTAGRSDNGLLASNTMHASPTRSATRAAATSLRRPSSPRRRSGPPGS